jgi:hypothetical protein
MAMLQVACLSLLLNGLPAETLFVQVAPVLKEPTRFERSVEQTRAVVLISGLEVHVFNDNLVPKARLRTWQQNDSPMVKALAFEADVFSFSYGQNVAVDEVAAFPAFGDGICRLKQLGYTEIVLVGHSAGGLVARQFVEDHPDAGVTKVIQTCAPNGGSSWGKLKPGVTASQRVFVESLTKESRALFLQKRGEKRIPEAVEFVCIVGTAAGNGDGVVACNCQWTEDLQKQGIPVVAIKTDHFSAVRTKPNVQKVAELVKEKLPRWNADDVATARKRLFGSKAEEPTRHGWFFGDRAGRRE